MESDLFEENGRFIEKFAHGCHRHFHISSSRENCRTRHLVIGQPWKKTSIEVI